MKYTIITLLLLTVLVTSLLTTITFDEAYAHHPSNKATLTSDQTSYLINDTITLTCTVENGGDPKDTRWGFSNGVSPKKHPAVYSFPASDFGLGEYDVFCFNHPHSLNTPVTSFNFSEKVIFFIVDEITPIDDLDISPTVLVDDSVPDENYADITYNSITHDITVEWNFGIKDSRENCYTKTNLGIDYMINGTLKRGSMYTFFGTDTTLYDIDRMFERDIVNEDMAIISCEGEFTFNINDFQLLDNFSAFVLWTSFYEKVDDKPQILNEVAMSYSEDNILRPDSCFGNTSKPYTDLYYDIEKELKVTGGYKADRTCSVEMLMNNPYGGVIPVNYTSVDFITYEEYPPHNTHNTHNTDNPQKKSGGSSPPPPSTFGKNKNLDQIVTDGFCFNDNCVDVTYYHTEFPLIVAPVGETSNITVKVYNPHGLNGIKAIQVVLGMPGSGEPLNNGEVINTFYLYQSEIDEIIIKDKNNLIGESTVSTNIVKCSDEFSSKCLELSFDFIPRDQLVNNVVAINTFNIHRAGTTNYLNDGVEFHGESMNEPLITHVSASKGGAFYPENRGSTELQLVSYREDLWQDKYGYLWTGDNHKSFVIISDIPVPIKEPDLMWSVMNRMNSNFDAMIIHEAERAVLVFDASKLISTPAESWNYDLPKSNADYQAELDIRIALEADRAEKELQKYFDYIYAGKIED